MKSRISDASTRRFFKGLYDRDRVAIRQIKEDVRRGLDAVTAATCQYCGFPDTSNLDHFLEKSRFPELSLFTPNLIPCCWRCNHDRKSAYKQDGTRRLLHFYDDDVDSMPDVLVADVSVTGGGTPVAEYSIAPSTHPLVEVYRNHFEALGLAPRYRDQAAHQLLVIQQDVSRAAPSPRPRVAFELLGKAESQTITLCAAPAAAAPRKCATVGGRAGALDALWAGLQPAQRRHEALRLRLDLHRAWLLTKGAAIPPTALLEREWRSSPRLRAAILALLPLPRTLARAVARSDG